MAISDEELRVAYLDAGDRMDWELVDILGAELNERGERDRLAEEARLYAPGFVLAAALWYAERGVPVFPCQVRGKLPLTAHGFKDASTDPDQLARWFEGHDDLNLAAATGVQFDVIDVDGREGCRSFYGQGVNVGVHSFGRVSTPRAGGWHVFVPPNSLDNRNRAGILPGVDYRSTGGYVLLPPSMGENGKRYKWTDPLLLRGELRR